MGVLRPITSSSSGSSSSSNRNNCSSSSSRSSGSSSSTPLPSVNIFFNNIVKAWIAKMLSQHFRGWPEPELIAISLVFLYCSLFHIYNTVIALWLFLASSSDLPWCPVASPGLPWPWSRQPPLVPSGPDLP